MSDNSNTGLTFGVDANVHNSLGVGQGQPLLLQKDFAGLSSQQLLTLAGVGIIEAWQNKTDPTQALVYAFAGIFGINFEANAQIAFGENFDIQKAKALGNDILGGNYGVLPDFQFTHSSEFNGAYAESLNTVYIDSVFVSQNAANSNAVGKVLVEELGHSIDAFASPVDSKGDEGKIISELTYGEKLSSAVLTSLKTENDHNVINIGGRKVSVEMDAVSGTANTLQTAKNIGVLGSASQPFTGFVGDSGINNYIKFQVTTPSVFAVELSGLAKNANVRLLDAQGSFIQASYNQGIAIDSFQHSLGVGTYYVHVYREAAGDNTNYTLKLSASSVTYPVDTAGNTIATAGKLGVLNGLQPFKEFVSLANDPLDLFEFKLTEYSNFKVSFAGMTAPISVKLLDASQNILQSFDPSTPQSFEIFKNLGAGTYYLAVASKGADTAYTFTTSAYGDVERYIDFSQSTSSNEVHTRTGWVGDMDVHDFIPFSIVKGGYVKLDLTGLTGNASLRLLYYPEGQYESVPLVNNGQYIDPAFVSKLIPVGASYNLGSQSESIYLNLDKVGKYFIHVYAETLQEKTPYTLRASFITDDAGNTPQTARLLQIPLNSSLSVSDRVHDGDTQDYYKVVLNGTSDVRFALQGKSADVNLKIFDQNLKFIQASYNAGLAEDVINLNNLAAGTYYVLVYQEKLGTDTEYTLQTSITGKAPVSSGGSTTIITQPSAVTPQWKIQYFNGDSPSGTPVSTETMGNPQNGNKLNFAFYWGENAPNSYVSKDNFSARVTGSSNLEAGEYRITVSSDDGIRVRANQQTIIDKWFDQAMSSVYTGTFITNGGNVPIEVDYYEKAGYAGLQFSLERIGNVPFTPISTPTPTNPVTNPITPSTPTTSYRISEPVNESQEWLANLYSWDRNSGSTPPADFFNGGMSNPKWIGLLNLGSNKQLVGKAGGLSFDWGTGTVKGNSQLPADGFAIRAYTWADFDGSDYKFTVRGDDGYQILAKNQASGEWFYITPKDQWQTQGYGVQSQFSFKLPAGRYDLHFHYFENGGEVKMDLSWNKVTTSNPSNIVPQPLQTLPFAFNFNDVTKPEFVFASASSTSINNWGKLDSQAIKPVLPDQSASLAIANNKIKDGLLSSDGGFNVYSIIRPAKGSEGKVHKITIEWGYYQWNAELTIPKDGIAIVYKQWQSEPSVARYTKVQNIDSPQNLAKIEMGILQGDDNVKGVSEVKIASNWSTKLASLLAGDLKGQTIGGGECVDFVKYMGIYWTTGTWKAADNVMSSGKVAVGTPIATFLGKNSTYNNPIPIITKQLDKDGNPITITDYIQHTAIFAGYGTENGVNGFYVWDQNWDIKNEKTRTVKKHFIKSTDGANTSNANNYYVIDTSNR